MDGYIVIHKTDLEKLSNAVGCRMFRTKAGAEKFAKRVTENSCSVKPKRLVVVAIDACDHDAIILKNGNIAMPEWELKREK